MLRYRSTRDHTEASVKALKHLPKVGKVRYVKGYRFMGKYGTDHEAVLVRGEHGSLRFSGFLWGYGGAGPNGLVQLLKAIGLPVAAAQLLAYRLPRRIPAIGEDWRLTNMSPLWKLTGTMLHVQQPINFNGVETPTIGTVYGLLVFPEGVPDREPKWVVDFQHDGTKFRGNWAV